MSPSEQHALLARAGDILTGLMDPATAQPYWTANQVAGALSLADVYRQQSQVASDELSLINAQNAFDKANADLVALIGLNVADEYHFADATISTTLDSTELGAVRVKYRDLGVLTNTALGARPDLLGAMENLDASSRT